YDGFDLTNINLTVPTGSVVGLIGSNGAGKTTTLKAALGLISVDGGNVEILGTNVNKNFSSQPLAEVKQKLGIVFDACAFPEDITVKDAATMMRFAYKNWSASTFEQYRAMFSLDPKKKIKELSRGMGMKLTLACALSHDPDFLILDEATAGLDPMAREEVLDIMRVFMQDENHGILMSSHITSDLEKIADYIVCVDNGQLVFSVEKDTITDLAGIAHCRSNEFEEIAASGFFAPNTMRFAQHAYGIAVLVPDRMAFSERFKSIAVDKASIDDYMGMLLKGGTR
ncbi:MAG: ABC transporter ATP-binding protein, partial [Raoultibacter sp.]